MDITPKTTEAKSFQTSTKDTSWICKRNALEMTTLVKGISSQALEYLGLKEDTHVGVSEP